MLLVFQTWRSFSRRGSMDEQDDYTILSEQIRECTKCLLCTTRHKVAVDRGDPTSGLVLICDAPGPSDDATGQFFVGRDGAELDALLNEAGIRSFLVTGLIKCRPPGDKFPGEDGSQRAADVVDTCLGWLDRQLQIVEPRVIVLVGGKAVAHTIFRGRVDPRVGDVVGKRLRSSDYEGVEIFAIYHPSFLLRLKRTRRDEYDKLREETVEALKAAKLILDGGSSGAQIVHITRQVDKGEQLNFF